MKHPRPLSNRRSQARLRRSAVTAVIEACESRLMMSATVSSTPEYDPILPITWMPKGGVKQDTGNTTDSGLGYTATQIRGAYGLGASGSTTLNFNGTSGSGSGQTIAVIDMYNDPTIATDLATFDTSMGLPAPPSFQVLNQSGQTSPLPSNDVQNPNSESDWAPEEALDVEWAHTMAPGANIIVIECSSSLEVGDATAAGIAGVSVISNSWGSSESSSEASQQDPYFTTPSGHAGVTFLASTGDSGAEISYPAESPNVVAVGGTALTVSASNTWSSETTWSSGGGGTSAYEAQPTYQAGTITATKRETPDISLDASPSTGVPIADAWDYGTTTSWAGVYGGTSLSSPMMAGLVADADQGRALENLTPLNSSQTLTRLYQLAKTAFHDITTGSNGHSAVTGYDEATGIGTPVANVMVPDLAGAGTITGRVFVDNAGNGVYGGSDTPVAGQVVYLDLNNDGVKDNSEPSATTTSTGIYTFTDEPAGGVVRLTSAAPTGYTLSSAASASIGYGVTDTINFTYKGGASQVVFVQQPTGTSVGSVLSSFAIAVQTSSGVTVTGDNSTVTLTLSGGTFSSGNNTATGIVSGGMVTFNALRIANAGTFTITASDGALTSAVSSPFTITAGAPTVSWTAPASITYGTTLGSAQLDATASVPGTFSYTPAAGTLLGAGSNQTLSVVFTPTDTADYSTAYGATVITVLQATPVLTWAAPAPITYGTALDGTELDAASSVSGTFAYTPAAGTLLGAGANQTLSVTFTPADTADYTTANKSSSITVTQATPAITWAAPAPITYGTALGSSQLDAASTVNGTFAYNPAAGTVLGVGANQTLSTTFTPADTADYTTATASVSITVNASVPQPVSLNGSSFYLRRDSANPSLLDIWTGSTATGTPAVSASFSSISSITLTSTAAGDSFTADFSNGTVVPAGGLTVTGSGPAAGNALTVVGTQGADTVTVPGDGTFNLNGQTVNYDTGSIGNAWFESPGLGEALTVPSGTVTLAPGTAAEVFSGISIAGGAELAVAPAASAAQRVLVQTSGLTIAGSTAGWTGTLDLANNDLDAVGGNFAAIDSQVAQGVTTGVGGIISSAAAADSTHLTTLGVIQNTVDGTDPLYGSGTGLGLFDGANPAPTDVLVKYTYFGDANLDGKVDGSDYSLVDNGYSNQLTGWYNGDFNYDGVVDGTDYSLLDNAFNSQTQATAAAQAARQLVSSKSAPVSNPVDLTPASKAALVNTPVRAARPAPVFSDSVIAGVSTGTGAAVNLSANLFVSDPDDLLKENAD